MHSFFFNEVLLNISLSFQMICECLVPEIPSCVSDSAAGQQLCTPARLGAACLGISLAVLGSADGSSHHPGAPAVNEAAGVTDGDSRYKGTSFPSLAGQR